MPMVSNPVLWARVVLLPLFLLPLVANAGFGALPDFTELVREEADAVVNISTTRNQRNAGSPHPFLDFDSEQIPEIFRHFFGQDKMPQGKRERRSMGSGFVISADGYVLTNHHVVDDADEIIVRLSDRRELEAELIGSDPSSDLALLKLDARDLPVVEIGNSEHLEAGEWVLAIGSPFGFDYSVTAGIVSAIGRSLPSESYVPFIQTDVAINPGNSGGPLFNLDGKVVGINSQIYTRSGGFMGLSFAIPINVAMEVVDQIREQGRVSRGWLGVVIQEVNKELAESFSLDKAAGALVAQVMPDSPAEKAGIRQGDIIISYEGHDIELSSELPHYVGRTRPGTKVELVVVRQGKRKTLLVELAELPDEIAGGGRISPPEPELQENALGIQVAPLTERKGDQSAGEQGVVVVAVNSGPARDAGIRVDDVISSINNQPVSSVEEFMTLVADLSPGRAVPVLVVRNGMPSFLVVRLPEGN